MRHFPEGHSCEIISSDGVTVREGFTGIGNVEDLDDLDGVSGSGENGLLTYLPNNKEFMWFVHPFKLTFKLL